MALHWENNIFHTTLISIASCLLSLLLRHFGQSCLSWIHVSFGLKMGGCVWYSWQFTFLWFQHLYICLCIIGWTLQMWFEPYQIQETLALEVTWEKEMEWVMCLNQRIAEATILWISVVTLLLPGFFFFLHRHIYRSTFSRQKQIYAYVTFQIVFFFYL